MNKESNTRDIFIKEFPSLAAEPAPLGLLGLAVAALVLASADLGASSSAAKSLMIPWVLFFGATAQVIAGFKDFKRNNIFGATVFTIYGMLWYAVGLTLILTIYTGAPFDLAHYGWGLVGVLAFSLIFTIASALANKVFFAILVGIDLAVASLVSHVLAGTSETPVGVFLVFVSLLSFYAAGAILINGMTGKTIFPMGSPLWVPRK